MEYVSFANQYPLLYSIVQRKKFIVAQVFGLNPLNIAFQKSLTENRWVLWLHLLEKLINIIISEDEDKFICNLSQSGKFSVKSMSLDMINGHTRYLRESFGKLKIHYRLEFFMWFFHRKVILTKDNLLKRNWQNSTRCCFCDKDETIQHLFLIALLQKLFGALFMSFGMTPSNSINHLFGSWLNGGDKDNKACIK
jgi:hypothetical protein